MSIRFISDKLRDSVLHKEQALELLEEKGYIVVSDDDGNKYEVSIKPFGMSGRDMLRAELARVYDAITSGVHLRDVYPQYPETEHNKIYLFRLNKPEYEIENREALATARDMKLKPQQRVTTEIQREKFPAYAHSSHYVIFGGSTNE